MRYVLIDSTARQIFDYQTPVPLGEELFARILRDDAVERLELAPELDLWVSAGQWRRTFQFFGAGAEFAGDGILTGRSLLGDFKSLPRWLGYEMISAWVNFPEPRAFDAPLPRRKYQRPTGLPQVGLALETYHGIAPHGARESPYLMQMYG